MFAEQLAAEVATASLKALDQLSRLTWQGHATGAIDDAAAQHLAEQIQHRRQTTRGEHKPIGLPPGRPSIFPPKRVQRSPDRAASIQRRRSLAASGPMPPTLACRFTTGELAVLRIVADAVRDNGQCLKSIPEIAARAGVCRTTAQNAIRMAARLGLLTVQERRRDGRRNEVNVVRIVSASWLAWIKRAGGFKKNGPTDTQDIFQGRKGPVVRQRTSPGTAPPGGRRVNSRESAYIDR